MAERNFDDLMKTLAEQGPALAGSATALLTGIVLLADDAHDFAKLDTPDHPSPLHHWIWGVLLLLGGAAGLGFALLNLLSSTPPETPETPKLPPSLIEQGAPIELVEKFK